MDKKDVIEFFDRCAARWDADMIKSDVIIGKILDNAGVGAGMDILDVACGTGVMFDYYLQRGAASVTGIDIAPEMARIASEKYAGESRVQVICGDVEEYKFDRKLRLLIFDAIERIEIALRTQVIYQLSHKYGSHWQNKKNIFKPCVFITVRNK